MVTNMQQHYPLSNLPIDDSTRTTYPLEDLSPDGKDQHEAGAKMDDGKLRPHLVLGGFSAALQAVTCVGTFGAAKYADNGWEDVPDGEARYTDAMMRHYLQEMCESYIDDDSELPHAFQTAWNALARVELMLRDTPEVLETAKATVKRKVREMKENG
jgi:hypothetical protein